MVLLVNTLQYKKFINRPGIFMQNSGLTEKRLYEKDRTSLPDHYPGSGKIAASPEVKGKKDGR